MTMEHTYPNQPLILHDDVISKFRINGFYLNRYLEERSKLTDYGRLRLITKRTRKTLTKKIEA